jgi:hypothetical protein
MLVEKSQKYFNFKTFSYCIEKLTEALSDSKFSVSAYAFKKATVNSKKIAKVIFDISQTDCY